MSCKSCKRKLFIDNGQSGIWATIALIILPKCPFCVLAYSSTVALCTLNPSPSAHTNQPVLTSLIIVFFSAFLTLVSIKNRVNKPGKHYPLIICLTGFVMIVFSLVFQLGPVFYYSSIAIIFIGIWINGSFHSFKQFIFSAFNKLPSQKNKNLKYY